MIALGRHILIEIFDADPDIINDPENLEKIFLASAEAANATVLSSHFHTFSPQGVSGVILISESHITVHSWPEHGYAAVDFFFCDEKVDVDSAIELLAENLNAGRIVITGDFSRGIISASGSSRDIPRNESAPLIHLPLTISWHKKFIESQAKAISLSIDLVKPDSVVSSDKDLICRMADELTAALNFKTDAGPAVCSSENGREHLLYLPGLQFTVSAHFAPDEERCHIDIYSTAFCEPGDAAHFCMKYLKAERYYLRVALRE
jgi:S-adenosylmethionine decarboxylase